MLQQLTKMDKKLEEIYLKILRFIDRARRNIS